MVMGRLVVKGRLDGNGKRLDGNGKVKGRLDGKG